MDFKSTNSYSHERLNTLEQTFQKSIQIIIDDPIMECFRENIESRQFMFDRMKEIIRENMTQANDDYVKEILERMDHMNIFTKSLKDEVIALTNLNQQVAADGELSLKKLAQSKDEEIRELKDKLDEFRANSSQDERIKSTLQEKLSAMKQDMNLVHESMEN